jgi:selenocysteine lyase/cysteine desulfurase
MRRRDLIGSLVAAELLDLPLRAGKLSAAPPPLPPASLYDSDPDAYWKRIRTEQFVLPERRAFLNTGTLGVAPKPVLQATIDYMIQSADLTIEEPLPRWGGEPLDEMRAELARTVGCDKDELALTHNTTEGMNMVANGLDLKPGDEVLRTDQEHPGGTFCWEQKAARFGITTREVKIPVPPKNSAELADAVVSAFGPRTRVISFSGYTTTTGLLLPVKAIAEAARAKGIISVVDGAHMPGQAPLDLHQLGCDYMAASPHKWMLTPVGCGFLYGRGDMLDRLWANVATYNWDNRSMKGARLMMIGTNNGAIFKGYRAAVRFFNEVGPERIYARIHSLARQTYARASGLPNVRLFTAEDDSLYGGMVSFGIAGADLRKVAPLFKKRMIWVVPGEDRVRVSCHIHTRPSDLDLFFSTLREGLAG